MVVQLSILVGNVSELLGLGFTHIEVHQSIDQANSYQEITGPAASAAVLDSTPALTTFRMGNRLLKLKVNGGAEQSISFSNLIQFWTPAQVVARINEVVAGLASVSGTSVRLSSSSTGRSSSIEVTYCDAEDLGWAGGHIVFGRAVRIPLSSGTLIYTFPDVAGKVDDRYKWRFSANGANPISEFSEVVQGSLQPVINSGSLSVALAQFYSQDGQPKRTRVLIAIDSAPQNVGGIFVGGGQTITVDSDDKGFFQATLLRGARVKVAVENSSFVREFVVPNQPSFQLFDVMATATDPYSVQTVPPLLIRRSL